MTLVRSWRSALLRASGALLMVPLGLLLAVAIAAWLTGVGDFGRVGQLVAGPGLPPASATEGAVPIDEHMTVPPVPVSPRDAALRSGGTVFAPSSTSPATRRRATTRPRTRTPTRRRTTTRPPSRTPTRPTATTPTTTTPSGDPTSQVPGAPRQTTGVVRRIGTEVDRIVRPMPIVGPATADAVNTVVQLLDPPPGRLSGPTTPR